MTSDREGALKAIAEIDRLSVEFSRRRRLSAAGDALAQQVIDRFDFRFGDRLHIPWSLNERLIRDLHERDGAPGYPSKLVLLGGAIEVVADPLLGPREAEFRNEKGKLLGKIVNLAMPPEGG